MFITALNGVALGLLISSFVRDPKTAINLIPIILIPQIILGGALIKYEEMNRNLDFVFSIRRLIEPEEPGGPIEPPSRLKVPLICEFMPLRYSYEAMIISQANNNPVAHAQATLHDEIQTLAANAELTDAQADRLDSAKLALAIVSGLEARTPGELNDMLGEILGALTRGSFDPDDFEPVRKGQRISGDEAFVNQKVLDLITKAEMERLDYREKGSQNVFFGMEKTIPFVPPAWGDANPEEPGFQIQTLRLNRITLTLFIILALLVLYLTLHHKMNKVT